MFKQEKLFCDYVWYKKCTRKNQQTKAFYNSVLCFLFKPYLINPLEIMKEKQLQTSQFNDLILEFSLTANLIKTLLNTLWVLSCFNQTIKKQFEVAHSGLHTPEIIKTQCSGLLCFVFFPSFSSRSYQGAYESSFLISYSTMAFMIIILNCSTCP